LEWFENFLAREMNYRIDGLTLEASLDILKNEIRSLIADKRQHVSDLSNTARTLQTHSSDRTRWQTIKQQVELLEQLLHKTEEQVEKRFVWDRVVGKKITPSIKLESRRVKQR
jgi:hypothetical protein